MGKWGLESIHRFWVFSLRYLWLSFIMLSTIYNFTYLEDFWMISICNQFTERLSALMAEVLMLNTEKGRTLLVIHSKKCGLNYLALQWNSVAVASVKSSSSVKKFSCRLLFLSSFHLLQQMKRICGWTALFVHTILIHALRKRILHIGHYRGPVDKIVM